MVQFSLIPRSAFEQGRKPLSGGGNPSQRQQLTSGNNDRVKEDKRRQHIPTKIAREPRKVDNAWKMCATGEQAGEGRKAAKRQPAKGEGSGWTSAKKRVVVKNEEEFEKYRKKIIVKN